MIRMEQVWTLALPVVGVLFLIWRRHRDQSAVRRTAYLELWEKAAEGVKVWERWRPPPSELRALFLWLACLAGALAAAKPSWMGPGGGRYRLILDRSASMTAGQGSGHSRFEEAVEAMQGFLRDRSAGDRVSLWSLGKTLDPVVAETDDLDAVLSALSGIAPSAESADFGELARGISREKGEIPSVLFSDSPAPGDWTLWGVGEPIANVAILSLKLGGAWPKKSMRMQGEIANFSSQEQKRTLRRIGPEGEEQRLEFVLGPGERQIFSMDRERGQGGEVHLLLDPSDGFSSDDRAAVTIAAKPQSPLILLGDGDSEGLSPLAAAATALSEEEGIPLLRLADPAAAPAGAVLLAEGGRFESLPPVDTRGARGGILFGCQIPGLFGEPLLKHPKVLDWKREHPVLRGLFFDFLACTRAWSVLGESEPLLVSADGPLLVSIVRGKARFLASGFRLADSNLPVQAHFPVLLGRAYAWVLGNPADGEARLAWGEKRVPFLHPQESSLEASPARGPSSVIPEGPGFARNLTGGCLIAAAFFLLLGLLLGLSIERWFR